MTRIDWLAALVGTALLSFAGLLLLGICGWSVWLALAIVEWAGPWVIDHIDAIVAAVCTVGAVCIVVMLVAERARKDNPSW